MSLNRAHVLMNKFSGPCDGDYQIVAGRIRDIFRMIREGRPLEMADDYINNTCYKASKLQIQRISGEILPVESCYINLVVTENHTKKKEDNQNDTPQSSQFSLYGRLNIETPAEDVQVDMWHLFDQRKGDNGEMWQPKRILIRGHAGVGKSTLCKKFVHDFKERNMWRDTFVRILWIPLRDLKKLDQANYNLEAMLHVQYFSQSTRGEELARELATNLEANEYGETLFILDGLDEVYEGLDSESPMFNFLEFLLKLPTVIVTSRPHALVSLGFDLELETIGFYPDQVKAYVESVFTFTEKGGDKTSDRQKIEGLQLLLERHQLLQGLVRIPIQLDALCYIWSDENSSLHAGSMLETMTSIYQAIVKRLWKKDILRLQKEGGAIVKLDIDHASLKATETSVPDELALLERLAFTGIVNDVISFNSSDWTGILDGKISHSLWKTFPRLSFLRTSDPSSGQPTFHFIHLTFQEYFAARYFVRQWAAGKPLLLGKAEFVVKEFLMEYKYEPRYDIFWRFVAGLLSLEGEEISRFFQQIESEPLDLIGPVHERLVMHCLSEVPLDKVAFSEERNKLECQLGQWLAFECELTGESRLVRAMEFPEAHLTKVLESASMAEREILVESLKYRPAVAPRVIRLACSWLQDDIGMYFKTAILEILTRHQGALDDEVLKAIVARFEDNEMDVRRVAIFALGRWSPLGNDFLNAVVTQAIDRENPYQLAAVEVLGGQSQLNNEIIDALVAQLENEAGLEDEGELEYNAQCTKIAQFHELHRAIIEALACQPQLEEEALRVISTQLKHKDRHVRHASFKALQDQPNLSDDISRTVTMGLVKEDTYTREEVLGMLGSWPQPNDKILDIVRAHLKNQDWHVRKTVIGALRKWPKLNDEILDIVAAHLKDDDEDVRAAAAETLASRPQLSPDILEAIKARANDQEECFYRSNQRY